MGKKVCGIANLGNTCYMNAALQCGILACEPLVRFFESRDEEDDSVARAITWLVEEVKNPDNRNSIYPSMVKTHIDNKIPRFRGTDQHDCSEFLIELLDHLHMELRVGDEPMVRKSSSMLTRSASSVAAANGLISGKSISSINWRSKGEQWMSASRKKDNSIIKQLYEGAIRSVMTCYRCGGVSARFEAFTSLILPLTPESYNQTLMDLIHELLRPEELDGIECDFCMRKQKFHRQLDVWKLPPFLMLTISRFSFDYRAVAKKLTNFINYPHQVNLESLLAKEAPLQEFTDYELYAVVEHEGTVNRGHYTALIKTNGKWVSVNDGRVNNSIDESRAITNNAYMLFYRWKVLTDSTFDLEEYLEY